MNKKGRLFHIGITGSYGGLNLGDEAILHSIIAQLRKSLHVQITVFSRNAEDTRRRHKVDKAIPVRQMTREEVIPEINALDLLIFGGGGLLFDSDVKTFLREVHIAHELGVPVMVYAIGAGPLDDAANHALVRECLHKAAIVTVRDRQAYHLLEEIGVRRDMTVTADPAFLLLPEPLPKEALKREGLESDEPLVGMSVREPGGAAPDLQEDKFHALLANVADYVVERFGARVVFVPMERAAQDMQHSHAVVARMLRPQHATVLKGDYSAGQMLALMQHVQFALGMRLHFLIFALKCGVPFVALPYASKVHGLLEHLQIEMPPLKLVNEGRLIAYIDRLWDRQRALKAAMRRTLPELTARARSTHEIAIQFLREQAKQQQEAAPAASPV
jgi:polysaccharide pyruvyl transferase CsaB